MDIEVIALLAASVSLISTIAAVANIWREKKRMKDLDISEAISSLIDDIKGEQAFLNRSEIPVEMRKELISRVSAQLQKTQKLQKSIADQ